MRIAAPWGVVDIEVTNSPEVSVVEPQSVPLRISVVLVEEAKVGGTQCLGCPHVDQDLRLLAGMAKPYRVTVCEDSHVSPCVGGTLSSSDLAGRLFPVVPAGMPLPVGPVGPVGLCPHLTLNLLARMARMLAGGLGGTLSSPDPAGMLFPAVPAGLLLPVGPVGPYGMLSPSDSGPAILVGCSSHLTWPEGSRHSGRVGIPDGPCWPCDAVGGVTPV